MSRSRSTSSATWSRPRRCPRAEVESERNVILEEIAMHDDDHDDVVHDLFVEALYGDSPLGRAITGTPETINALSRKQIAATTVATTRRTAWCSRPPAASTTTRWSRWSSRLSRKAGALGRDTRRSSAGTTTPPTADPARHDGRGRAPCRADHVRHGRALLRAQPSEPIRPGSAELSARRRHVEPPLPGGARAARPGLHDLLVRQPARRRRILRDRRRVHPAQPAGRARHLPRRAREGRVGRASPSRSSSAARASCGAVW